MLTQDYIKEINTLVNRANSRLRAIEKLSQQETYKHVKEFAYKYAEKDVERLRGKNAPVRFLRAPSKLPTNKRELRALEIRLRRTEKAIDRFMNAQTSSVSGIRRIYKERAVTFNEATGLNLTADEFAQVFESGLWDMLTTNYGSETSRRMVATITNQKERLKQLMEQNKRVRLDAKADIYSGEINDILSGKTGKVRNVAILKRYLRSL